MIAPYPDERGGERTEYAAGMRLLGGRKMLQKHPNEFTRRIIHKYFADHQMPAQVNAVRDGYVVFLHYFSVGEACNVDEASGRLVYNDSREEWKLYWMSGNFRWHLYEQCPTLHQSLDVMLSEEAANLFHKVL